MKTITVQAQQKWENNCLTRKTEATLINELNDLGQAGWELVTVLYYKDIKGAMAWTAFIKRPASGEVPKHASQAAPAVFQPVGAASKSAAPTQGFDLSDDDFKMAEE
jgi:hypothetical protein